MSGTQLAIEGGLGSTKDKVWGLLKDSELVLQVMCDMELVTCFVTKSGDYRDDRRNWF